MKVLIICSANSCRSQMAEAILKKLDPDLVVRSAGPEPAAKVHPFTVQALNEVGIDITQSGTNNIVEYLEEEWDYVITVCDIARDKCPTFTGKVKNSVFLKFDDPLAYDVDDEKKLKFVRNVRDEIFNEFEDFYHEFLTRE